jgi:hypothetical protein
MFQNRERAGARWNLGVGTQHGKIGLPAVEPCQCFCVVGVGQDFQTQPRKIILQYGVEPGGEAGLGPVGITDGEGQRFGVAQPYAATPDGCDRQNQGQHRKQKHLSAIAADKTLERWPVCSWRWHAHGTHPGTESISSPSMRKGPPEPHRKYLERNDNFTPPG